MKRKPVTFYLLFVFTVQAILLIINTIKPIKSLLLYSPFLLGVLIPCFIAIILVIVEEMKE